MNKKGSLFLLIPILLCALIFSFTLFTTASAEESIVKVDPSAVGKKAVPIDVILGKETVLKINKPPQEIKQVSLANNEIADIKPLLAFPAAKMVEVIIAGKKPGITSLIVWDPSTRQQAAVLRDHYRFGRELVWTPLWTADAEVRHQVLGAAPASRRIACRVCPRGLSRRLGSRTRCLVCGGSARRVSRSIDPRLTSWHALPCRSHVGAARFRKVAI